MATLVAIAVASAPARAEPELLTKAAVATGQKIPFNTTSVGTAVLETKGGTKVACAAASIIGEIGGAEAPAREMTNVFVTLTGCESSAVKCQNTGEAGEVVTKSLHGALGAITATGAGIKLFPTAGKGTNVMEFACGAASWAVKGEVTTFVPSSGTSAETNTLSNPISLTYHQTGGVQKYLGFKGGEKGQLEVSVNGGSAEAVGLEADVDLRTVPTTWGLGITHGEPPQFMTKAVVGEHGPSNIPIKTTLGSAFIMLKSGTIITCTGGQAATGEVAGARNIAGMVIRFTGCETGGNPCENGAAKEIITRALVGNLNGITSSLPGIRLFSEAEGRGGVLAEYKCAGVLNVIVKGSIIGSLSGAAGTNPETGKLSSGPKLTFAESAGTQKYCAFTEGPEKGECEQLESSTGGAAFEQQGWSVIATIKTVPSTWEIGVTR